MSRRCYDEIFEVVTSNASKTYPLQCSALRKHGYAMIKSHPCKIVEMNTSAPGKHGHAKVHLVGVDVFTSKKYETICPSTHNVEVPNIMKYEMDVMEITGDGFLSLIGDKGETRYDIKLPDGDLGDDIIARFTDASSSDGVVIVTILSAMDQERIIQAKSAK